MASSVTFRAFSPPNSLEKLIFLLDVADHLAIGSSLQLKIASREWAFKVRARAENGISD
jgi:hypothetical protein